MLRGPGLQALAEALDENDDDAPPPPPRLAGRLSSGAGPELAEAGRALLRRSMSGGHGEAPVCPPCEAPRLRRSVSGGGGSVSGVVGAAPAPLTCPICLDDADEVAEIGCGDGHLVCAPCLREYLKARVAAGETRDDQLVCPMPQCGWALPEAKVAASLRRTTSGEAAYSKLQDSRARRAAALLPDGAAGERLVQCPAPDCAPFIVPARAREVRAPPPVVETLGGGGG